MTLAQPHPLRCETCNFKGEYSSFTSDCPLDDYNLLNEHDIVFITEKIGCASHSSRPTTSEGAAFSSSDGRPSPDSAEQVLEPSYKEMVDHIRWTQTLWIRGQEIMRNHNFVIDNLDDKMQKLAFTFYTDLCEIGSKAEHLFGEGYGESNYNRRQEEDERIRVQIRQQHQREG